jgi:hypothetical protein
LVEFKKGNSAEQLAGRTPFHKPFNFRFAWVEIVQENFAAHTEAPHFDDFD